MPSENWRSDGILEQGRWHGKLVYGHGSVILYAPSANPRTVLEVVLSCIELEQKKHQIRG